MRARLFIPSLMVVAASACDFPYTAPPTCIGALTDACRKGQDLSAFLGFELGSRVGILEETPRLPGVGLSWMSRSLPPMTVSARADDYAAGQSFAINLNNLKVSTSSLRLVASKTFGSFTLSGGTGADSYQTSSHLVVASSRLNLMGEQPNNSSVSRTHAFVGATYNLHFVKLSGEVGETWGNAGTTMVNSFGGAEGRPSGYFTLGVRVGN